MSAVSKSKTVRKPQPVAKARMLLLVVVSLAVLILTLWLLSGVKPAIDFGSAAGSKTTAFTPNAQPNFEATIANSSSASSLLPEGMVFIPGGEFSMYCRLIWRRHRQEHWREFLILERVNTGIRSV